MAPRVETIKEIFHAALDCAPDQLSAFLDQSCAGDEDLRGKVEALLTSHRQAESFIENSIGAAAADIVGQTQLPRIGTRFGVYEIDRREDGSLYELGSGAMGVTYRATDTELQRKVALKIIKIDIAERSADARERFMREARAAASLRHENIATVYQFGMCLETGQYFYAMELIEGE